MRHTWKMQLSRVPSLVALMCLAQMNTFGTVYHGEGGVCGCPHSCAEAELLGLVHFDKPMWIFHIDSSKKVLASCRLSEGGGWTVIQRRVDGSLSFHQGWDRYRYGFGWRGPRDEMWFGNEHIRAVLRAHGRSELQIKLEADDGARASAEYRNFQLDDEENMYRMHVDVPSHLHNTGDSLFVSNGSRFSTRDRDVDTDSCAEMNDGGWWWPEDKSRHCMTANLNGLYHGVGTFSNFWSGFRGLHGLNYSEMRVRPSYFSSSRAERKQNPCEHGGQCEFDGKTSTYKCVCAPDHWGERCHRSMWFEPIIMAAVFIGVATPVVLLGILIKFMHPSMMPCRSSDGTEQPHLLHLEASKATLSKDGEDVAILEKEVKHQGKRSTKRHKEHKKHNKSKKPKRHKSNATM